MTFSADLRYITRPAILLWALAGCSQEITVTEPPPTPPTGPWQATISIPGGEIETAFEINKRDTGYVASLVNGQERVSIDEVNFSGGEMLLSFPVFNSEIRAHYVDGKLIGTLTLVKRYGETQQMPFLAQPGTEHPHAGPRTPATVDLSGRWAASFLNEDGSVSPSIGEFAQRGSRLFGTFVNVEGDHRYLAGHVSGQSFELSTFDGAHAYLFRGQVVDGRISDADFWSGTEWHQKWSADRNESASLPDAYDTTHLKPDIERLSFSFPDQDGAVVSLDDEKFQGKVVIVSIAGTWCPNCNDEARFLAELDRQFADEDLAVVALMFEHFEDMQTSARQVKRFRQKHAITFDTLIAGISDKTIASEKLPDLDAVLAFPTTIFIDRVGKVRTIHTGFSGPGTGEYHERLKAEFTALVKKMINEEAIEPVAEPQVETAETVEGE